MELNTTVIREGGRRNENGESYPVEELRWLESVHGGREKTAAPPPVWPSWGLELMIGREEAKRGEFGAGASTELDADDEGEGESEKDG